MLKTSLLEQARSRRPGASNADCVREIAAQVITDLGVDEPPVDVELVASWLGIASIIEDDSLEQAGCLICDGDTVRILIRRADPPGRRRFTIGHECGHTFFPGYSRTAQYRCDPSVAGAKARLMRGGHLDTEQLCDLAASELLLPPHLVRPAVQAAPFGLNSLEWLASAYGASLEATARRYVQCWPEAAALLVLHNTQSPRERGSDAPERLRVAYRTTVGDWPFIPPHKSVSASSPFGRALLGEPVHERALVSEPLLTPLRVDVAARAYPYVSGGRPVNRVIALLRQPSSQS